MNEHMEFSRRMLTNEIYIIEILHKLFLGEKLLAARLMSSTHFGEKLRTVKERERVSNSDFATGKQC